MESSSSDHPFRRLLVQSEPMETSLPCRLERLHGIKAVVFDIYGTLVVSGTGDVGSADPDLHASALGDALGAVGMPIPKDLSAAHAMFRSIVIDHQQVRRERGVEFPEVDILAVWREWLGRMETTTPIDTGVVCRLALEFETRANPSCAMPGAAATIRRIAASEKLLGIVSNAQFFTLDLLDVTLGGGPIALGFDPNLSIFSYRFGAAKPGSQLFALLIDGLRRVGVSPSEALYVGNDMLNDVFAAKRAGLKAALFAGDLRSLRLRENDARLDGCDADVVITSLSQLVDVL